MIITLIGSTRFKGEYERVNRLLSKAGHVVLSVSCFNHADNLELSPQEKEALDLVHLQKVAMADMVYIVTDSTGYVGESTKREVMWAKMNGKDVRYSTSLRDELGNNHPLNLRYGTFPVLDKLV